MSEIEKLKEKMYSYNYDFDEYKRAADELIAALESRIGRLQNSVATLRDISTYYQDYLRDLK